jgi:hypothetical protein
MRFEEPTRLELLKRLLHPEAVVKPPTWLQLVREAFDIAAR